MVKLATGQGNRSYVDTQLKIRLKSVRKRNYNRWKYLYIKKHAVAPRINEYTLHGSGSKPRAINVVKLVKI